jgi:5-methylcytosine-specific restriction endonuclease McrA
MKRKFAAANKPRTPRQHSAAEGRYVPAHVRRAVWERDGGQCTFVSETGHRCPSRRFLELDHIEPVARGGRPTVDNTRLRCRAHNQYEAEQILGAEFMRQKRQQARDGRRSASA